MKLLRILLSLYLLSSPAHAVRDLLVGNNSTTVPNGILRFDGTTGASKGYFIQPGAGGLLMPSQMIVGPDGNLWIADWNANTIKKFDFDGVYLGEAISGGSISIPVALKIGPDSKVYVLSGESQRKIHRFSTSGVFEATVVSATSTQISTPKDFIFMPGTNDFLITSSLHSVARFNFITGAFVSHYLNPTRTSSFIRSPTGIIIGPDGNYWVASSIGTNRISRFLVDNVAQRTDLFLGSSNSNGHQQIVMEGEFLYVANGANNNIIRYDAYSYLPPASTGTSGGDVIAYAASLDEDEFVLSGTNGLTNPRGLLFVDINDPPVANAGSDLTVAGGGLFALSGSASQDPEGVALSYQWTQSSGTPARTSPSTPLDWNTQPGFSLVAPYMPTLMTFQLTVSDGAKTGVDQVTVQVGGFVDLDSDGMPDLWEAEVGFNPALADGGLDADQDGASNRSEFYAGTDPFDAGSVLKVLEHQAGAGNFSLRFSSVPGRRYALQSSDSLNAWIAVPGSENVVATSSETTVTDTRSRVSRRFYRIAVKAEGF